MLVYQRVCQPSRTQILLNISFYDLDLDQARRRQYFCRKGKGKGSKLWFWLGYTGGYTVILSSYIGTILSHYHCMKGVVLQW